MKLRKPKEKRIRLKKVWTIPKQKTVITHHGSGDQEKEEDG